MTDDTMDKRKGAQKQTMIFRIQHETPQKTRGEPTNIISNGNHYNEYI